MHKKLFVLLIVVLLLTACGGQGLDENAVQTIVAATLQAAASEQAPPESTATPEAQTGSISGELSFPSEAIPPLNVVAYDVDSDDWYLVQTEFNQFDYQIDDLPPGTYNVVAYPQDADFGGGYTAAVPCGLSVDCEDHSLLPVEVVAGETTEGIDPADWYAPEDAFPPNPQKIVNTGSIAGTLIYPSEFIPAQRVVAFNVDTDAYFFVDTQQNQSDYQIDDLPEGTYFVVTYVQGQAEGAGYSYFVTCGLDASCTDHSLIPVQVVAGGTVEDVNPHDWYAGPGAFPINPTQ